MRKATLDLNSRGSFVDDLNSKPGIVMCRDALLHRSHEIQPAFFYDSAGKSNFFCFFFLFFPCSGPVRGTRAPPDPAPECHVQVQVDERNTHRSGDIARFSLRDFLFTERARLQRKLRRWTVQHLRPNDSQAYLLGLLAKIKCSICSYQLNLWYVAHGVT